MIGFKRGDFQVSKYMRNWKEIASLLENINKRRVCYRVLFMDIKKFGDTIGLKSDKQANEKYLEEREVFRKKLIYLP